MKTITYDPSKWQLVPKSLDGKTLYAVFSKLNCSSLPSNERINNLRDMHTAMLSASPTPEDVKPADGGEPVASTAEIVKVLNEAGEYIKTAFKSDAVERISALVCASSIVSHVIKDIENSAEPDANLRMMVRRMCRRLPVNDVIRLQAEDYLRRTFKASDVLREGEEVGRVEQSAHPDRTNEMLLGRRR